MVQTLESQATIRGASVAGIELFDPNSADLSTPARRLAELVKNTDKLAVLVPVAWVVSTRDVADDDAWDHEQSHIVLDEAIPTDALSGIETFSHLEIIAVAHQVAEGATHSWRRRPRGRTEWPEQGIFAQRNKDRPNRLLSTVVELVRVDNRELHVRLEAVLDAEGDREDLPLLPKYEVSGRILDRVARLLH